MTFNEYHSLLLEYLSKEKEYEEEDIKKNESLSDEEKIEGGLLIPNAMIVERDENTYRLSTPDNNSKLRPGDSVEAQVVGGTWIKATVIENSMDGMIIDLPTTIVLPDTFNIKVSQKVMLDSIIQLIEEVTEGAPGSFYLEELANIKAPKILPFGGININDVLDKPTKLNEAQYDFYLHTLKRPTISCLQGPPGTGKTDVLANIAKTFSEQGHEVLILSLTHQAVNNALNKIDKYSPKTQIVKVGPALKGTELSPSVYQTNLLSTYIKYKGKYKRKKKNSYGDVIGMTIHSAVTNLGLRSTGFTPSIVLVDEASQIPITLAATIGAVGCGSIIFIGDDKQMPPIFHEKLEGHPLSKSIFNHLCDTYPDIKHRLSVTYRMNDVITEVCSRNYYEPFGEKLIPSDFSKNRRFELHSDCEDADIRNMLNDPAPIMIHNPSENDTWEDENPEEAKYIAKLVKEAITHGISANEIAVITPYRLQVRAIRACILDELGRNTEIPLVDTVERLQGQDVDLIIISFSVSSEDYFKSAKSFLLNPNRLNVMISRAKKKVVIVASDVVMPHVNNLKDAIN